MEDVVVTVAFFLMAMFLVVITYILPVAGLAVGIYILVKRPAKKRAAISIIALSAVYGLLVILFKLGIIGTGLFSHGI